MSEKVGGTVGGIVARPWWERPGLEAAGGRLHVAGRDAETLARRNRYAVTSLRPRQRAGTAADLRGAFERAGLPHKLRVALKAQRSPEFLAALRALGVPGSPGAVGLDACSLGEVEHALAHGFLPLGGERHRH